MCVCVHVCVCACMHACVCVRACVPVCVRMHVCVRVYVHAYAHVMCIERKGGGGWVMVDHKEAVSQLHTLFSPESYNYRFYFSDQVIPRLVLTSFPGSLFAEQFNDDLLSAAQNF